MKMGLLSPLHIIKKFLLIGFYITIAAIEKKWLNVPKSQRGSAYHGPPRVIYRRALPTKSIIARGNCLNNTSTKKVIREKGGGTVKCNKNKCGTCGYIKKEIPT
ncbi:hypothetical protein XENTR_v10005514 [Xenopus tropicalis]|nr:hypothetical protein XENTR_v10005514 [Xenopus tropicalis]